MKRRFNLRQNKKQKNNMDSEEKKSEEMKDKVENPTPEEDQPVEGEVQTEAEEPEKELTPEEKLQAQVDELTKEQEEMKDKYLRLSAEFDNYRKRTMKEKADIILNGSAGVVTDILPVIDDLERAISNSAKSEDFNALKEGIELIYNKLMHILEQKGLQKISPKNEPFDTDFHEAIAMIPAPSEDLKGKVLDCAIDGYKLNDKVLRHAKVAVGQ